MSLTNKVALITGAANGIGQATAIRFARDGAQLVITDVDGEGLEATCDTIKQAGGKAVTVIGSVISRDDVQRCDAAVPVWPPGYLNNAVTVTG
jgi:NAD(P)-dependent dehydrogenase (short-subunit alcohol dehydrogenase family)